MTRSHVLEVVIKHLKANVDELDAVAIDPARSLADYGASSLDLVEIVSCAMRELGIKVPRTQLTGLVNIDGLVDTLFAAQQATVS